MHEQFCAFFFSCLKDQFPAVSVVGWLESGLLRNDMVAVICRLPASIR